MYDPDVTKEEYLNDYKRIEFISDHLDNLMAAMREGADVRGYFVWSLLNNFEWKYGFSVRFGLHHVDYATLKRTPKLSASWYKRFIQNYIAHNIVSKEDEEKRNNQFNLRPIPISEPWSRAYN